MTITDKEFVIRTMVDALQKYLGSEFPNRHLKNKNLDDLRLSATFIDHLFLNGMSITSAAVISKKQMAELLNITVNKLMDLADFLAQQNIIAYSDKNGGNKLMVKLIKFPDEIYRTIEELYEREVST